MSYVLRGKITRGLSFQVDKTLSHENVAADAKATGDAINEAEERVRLEINEHKSDSNNPHNVTAVQVGARPDTWMPSAEDIGARSIEWLPTAEEVGARPDTWMPSAEEVGARSSEWLPTPEEIGGQYKHTTITVSLLESGWSQNLQSVTANGVTENNTLIVSPSTESFDSYCGAGVHCIEQLSGGLRFKCNDLPDSSLTVNVIILN